MSVAASQSLPIALPTEEDGRATRVGKLLARYDEEVCLRTHRLFTWLLTGQWLFALFVSLVWSPRAWAGQVSSIHPHVIAAAILGGLLTMPPILMVRLMPMHGATRHVVAIAQVSFSALLIHLTGGRIETHFHVFGSLAFLALYRDWPVLITATGVVGLDHLLRGMWFPQSVYGVPYSAPWRTGEHVAWVLFEVVVLCWACVVSRREMLEICERQDQNDVLRHELEERVRVRTADLEAAVEEQRRTGARLRESEDRFRKLVVHAPIGIFKTLRDGRVRIANPHLLRIIGLPADHDIQNIALAEGSIFSTSQRERFWHLLLTEKNVQGYVARLTRPDGVGVDVVVNARLLPYLVDGQPACEGTVEDVTERVRAAQRLDELHQQLVAASRQAGMAEVANGVLHNVGNILTSVNLTLTDARERLQRSRVAHLQRAAGLLQRDREQLASYLTSDPAGRQLPEFLARLGEHLQAEHEQLGADLANIDSHFEHIREIVVTQQSSAKVLGTIESLTAEQLFEDALRLTARAIERHSVAIVRDYSPAGYVLADRHRVLQILVNLIQNGKDALAVLPHAERRLRLGVARSADGKSVELSVRDNGSGIEPANLAHLFERGFTTKPEGHGFGLHSCANAAREMRGDLRASSDGPGMGATFTLTLPLAPAA